MDICLNLRVNILFCDLQVEDDVAVMICIVPLSRGPQDIYFFQDRVVIFFFSV